MVNRLRRGRGRGRSKPKLDYETKKGDAKKSKVATQQKEPLVGSIQGTLPSRPSRSTSESRSKLQKARQGSSSTSKISSNLKEKVTLHHEVPQSTTIKIKIKGLPLAYYVDGVSKFKYAVNESVLCHESNPTKAKALYDAKVIDINTSQDGKGGAKLKYLVHFNGWKSKWDRYVEEDMLEKDSAENRQLQMKLKENANALKESLKKGKKTNENMKSVTVDQHNQDNEGGKSDSESSDESSDESSVDVMQELRAEILQGMVIPKDDALLILDYDNQCIVEDKKLAILPAKKCIINIFEDYIKETGWKMLGSWIEKRKLAIKDMMRLNERRVVSSSKPTISTMPQSIIQPPVIKKKTPIEISDEELRTMVLRIKFIIEFIENLRMLFDYCAGLNIMLAEEDEQFENSKTIRCNPRHVYTQRFDFDSPEPEEVVEVNEVPVQSKKENGKPEISKGKGRKSIKLVEPVKEEEKPKSSSASGKRQTRSSAVSVSDVNISAPKPKRRGTKPNSSTTEAGKVVPFSGIKSRNNTVPKVIYELYTDKAKKVNEFLTLYSLVPKKAYTTIPCQPTLLYGVPHLLRLFVKLPDILIRQSHTLEKLKLIVKHLNLLLRFIAQEYTVDPSIYSFDGQSPQSEESVESDNEEIDDENEEDNENEDSSIEEEESDEEENDDEEGEENDDEEGEENDDEEGEENDDEEGEENDDEEGEENDDEEGEENDDEEGEENDDEEGEENDEENDETEEVGEEEDDDDNDKENGCEEDDDEAEEAGSEEEPETIVEQKVDNERILRSSVRIKLEPVSD